MSRLQRRWSPRCAVAPHPPTSAAAAAAACPPRRPRCSTRPPQAAPAPALPPMKTLRDDTLAYEFTYPAATAAGKPLPLVFSRKPERYSSAAPLTADARQRIVCELADLIDAVTVSVTVSEAGLCCGCWHRRARQPRRGPACNACCARGPRHGAPSSRAQQLRRRWLGCTGAVHAKCA